jgi:hypothetical protein
MNRWTWQQLHGLEYITVPSWQEKGAQVVFTARTGGLSSQPCHSLNLALHVGDDPEKVVHNRQLLMQLFGLGLEDMVSCQQIHGSEVGIVSRKDRSSGAYSDQTALCGWDGMITDQTDLALATFYADCIPLFFFDPARRVIAVSHSGWKGTYLQIAAKTVQAMVKTMGSVPGDIQAFIGPGIGACCYRVQPDLVQKVKDRFRDFSDIIYEDEHGYTWDLKATNEQILMLAGIPWDNIITCPLCTACYPERFFSYRRDQGQTGRMGAAIALRK